MSWALPALRWTTWISRRSFSPSLSSSSMMAWAIWMSAAEPATIKLFVRGSAETRTAEVVVVRP